jgi:hypothetical protein
VEALHHVTTVLHANSVRFSASFSVNPSLFQRISLIILLLPWFQQPSANRLVLPRSMIVIMYLCRLVAESDGRACLALNQSAGGSGSTALFVTSSVASLLPHVPSHFGSFAAPDSPVKRSGARIPVYSPRTGVEVLNFDDIPPSTTPPRSVETVGNEAASAVERKSSELAEFATTRKPSSAKSDRYTPATASTRDDVPSQAATVTEEVLGIVTSKMSRTQLSSAVPPVSTSDLQASAAVWSPSRSSSNTSHTLSTQNCKWLCVVLLRTGWC